MLLTRAYCLKPWSSPLITHVFDSPACYNNYLLYYCLPFIKKALIINSDFYILISVINHKYSQSAV